MIEESQQYKKWQWINVHFEKSTKDHRLESHKLYVDTILIDTTKGWSSRRTWLDKIPSFNSFNDLETVRLIDRLSLALLRPKKIVELEIQKARNPNIIIKFPFLDSIRGFYPLTRVNRQDN